jgi:hypothetical protein
MRLPQSVGEKVSNAQSPVFIDSFIAIDKTVRWLPFADPCFYLRT